MKMLVSNCGLSFSDLHIYTFANLLVVTFLTFQTTDVFHAYTIHFTRLQIIMEFFINAVELVSSAVAVVEGDFGFAVTVDTPAHA